MPTLSSPVAAPPGRELYAHRSGLYEAMIRLLRYPQGLARYFAGAAYLRPDLRVLDAGCGTGAATLALRAALAQRQLPPAHFDGFDLTPGMLSRFRHALDQLPPASIGLAVADVLALEDLPATWQGYDLIISSAMLEYLPKADLATALRGLRQRLRPDGTLVVFISRQSFSMRLLIGRWWHANLYAKAELRTAFQRAGFSPVAFEAFPRLYRYLNAWGHIIVAKPALA